MSRNRSKSSALASLLSIHPVCRCELTELGYYDLFLLHSPHGGRDARLTRYKALLEAKARGLVRTVGVSNLCVVIIFGVRYMAMFSLQLGEAYQGNRGSGVGKTCREPNRGEK